MPERERSEFDEQMEADAQGLREEEYHERRAEQRRALGPEYEEEGTEDYSVCFTCSAAEGTIERADGNYDCADCHADAVDRAYERGREP